MNIDSEKKIEWESHPGMVTVYDSKGHYLGCMGIERWRRLLIEDGPRCDVWTPFQKKDS